MTTYYLLKDLPGYLSWSAHTVQHWVIQTTLPGLMVITASPAHPPRLVNKIALMLGQCTQRWANCPNFTHCVCPHASCCGHYRGDHPPPPLAGDALGCTNGFNAGPAAAQYWLNIMCLLACPSPPCVAIQVVPPSRERHSPQPNTVLPLFHLME